MTMTSQFSDMTLSSNFLDVVLFLLSSLVTGPSFMSISSMVLELWQFSFIRGCPEIGNTTIWFLPNIWRLGRVRDTKFGINVSNEMLLNVAKCQGFSFDRFWVIKGKQGRGWNYPLPRLGLTQLTNYVIITYFSSFFG